MAAKKEVRVRIKITCPGGQATPAPPVGPTLSQYQIPPGEFTRRFNELTKNMQGILVPAVVTIYTDKSFEIELKTPPASFFLKRAAGIVKGSGNPKAEKVGKVTRKHLEEIAEKKMRDLNCTSIESAIKMLEGTARNMGIVVEG